MEGGEEDEKCLVVEEILAAEICLGCGKNLSNLRAAINGNLAIAERNETFGEREREREAS